MSTEKRFESDPSGTTVRSVSIIGNLDAQGNLIISQASDRFAAFNSPGLTSEVILAEQASFLRSLQVFNSHSGTLYMQVFDSASAVADGQVPIMVVPVATKQVGTLDFGYDGYEFLNGIYACLSSTDTTKTEAGAVGFWWSRAA